MTSTYRSSSSSAVTSGVRLIVWVSSIPTKKENILWQCTTPHASRLELSDLSPMKRSRVFCRSSSLRPLPFSTSASIPPTSSIEPSLRIFDSGGLGTIPFSLFTSRGPTGCGKTSTVMQFMARVNAPVISVTCTKRFVKDDLVGRWGAVKGGFCWFDAPATIAWKTGAVLVINEFSLAPPETWVGVNDIFEGQSITIEKTGIAVPRHPNARIIITDNCRCAAAAASNYQARSEQDASTSDRFWHIAADWPDESAETDIIRRRVLAVCANLYAPLAGELSRCTAKLAAFTRQPQKGSDNDPNKAMPVISTRVAVRLGEILACLLASGKEFDAALEQAVRLAAASAYAPARSTALMQAARFHFITLEEAIKASGSTTRSR